MNKALLIVTALLIGTVSLHAQTITSPNGRLAADIHVASGQVSYTLLWDGQPIVTNACAHLDDGQKHGSARFSKSVRRQEHIAAPHYRQASFDVTYNETRAQLGGGLSVCFRLYDDGCAYRFETTKRNLTIHNEQAEWPLPPTAPSWLAFSTNPKKPEAMAFQNIYSHKPLAEQPNELGFLPLTADLGSVKLTLLEADVEAYPGMFVSVADQGLVHATFARYPKSFDHYAWRGMTYVSATEDYIARTTTARTFPWRIMAVSTDDTQMPLNNLVYALAAPNRIGDASWVKPGKVAWDWWNDWSLCGVPFKAGINIDTYKYFIDFAAQFGLPYIILDEGWYDSKKADLMNPVGEVDLTQLIAYGRERGVGIILWTVFNVLDEHLEEACRKYADMGVKGFKVDFLDRNDQTASEMIYRIAEVAARHRLLLDLHGTYPPTGYDRTYPNIVNVESVFGMEEAKWNENGTDMPLYDVTFPFIRMMCGPVDFTPGAMRNGTKQTYKPIYAQPMSMGTRCHQLGTYVVYDSPLTMLADAPTNYQAEPLVPRFIASIPDQVAETLVLAGRIGEFIVVARRYADGSWAVGGLTNWDARDVEVSFSFLPQGKAFEANIMSDGPNAEHNAEDYQTSTSRIDNTTSHTIHMASGGGFAITLKPMP